MFLGNGSLIAMVQPQILKAVGNADVTYGLAIDGDKVTEAAQRKRRLHKPWTRSLVGDEP